MFIGMHIGIPGDHVRTSFVDTDVPGLAFDFDATADAAAGRIAIATGVSNWTDPYGHTIAQAVAGQQPAFSAAGGPNAAACITTDGADDLVTGAFAFAQPEEVWIVGKWNVPFDVAHSVMFDGSTLNSMLFFRGSSGGLSMHAGSTIPSNGSLTPEAWHIYRCVYAGAASHVDNDGVAGPVANAGANNGAGLTLGATATGTVAGAVSIARVIGWAGALTAIQAATVLSNLKARYAL